jgi:hypothetical protein
MQHRRQAEAVFVTVPDLQRIMEPVLAPREART